MADDRPVVFTIGHSNHSLEEFIALLRRHGITALADVRSQPYGRLAHFHREDLSAELTAAGIEYVFLGQHLGARRDEPECYNDGVARYDDIARLSAFQEGLAWLQRNAQSHRLAVMCAEKEPLDCHRGILISRRLAELDVDVKHILADGRLEDHAASERRLVRMMGIERTLFEPNLTERAMIDRAYERRGNELAYQVDQDERP